MQNKHLKNSYSKISTFEQCPFKFHLIYEENHYIFSPNLANEFGTLVHKIEQRIGICIKNKMKIDYQQLKKEFAEAIVELQKKYKEEFFVVDDNGMSYDTKANYYIENGIYELERYMNEHPELEIFGTEVGFEFNFEDRCAFTGSIDRVFYNKEKDTYIIEDIKTKSTLFKATETATPLQFVFYCLALQSITSADVSKMSCFYYLPFCQCRQPAGRDNFVENGIKLIEKRLDLIQNTDDRKPNPCPLCYWCDFSETNPKQPEEGKNLCPYFWLWTPENKIKKSAHKWEGKEAHEKILGEYIKEKVLSSEEEKEIEFDFEF